MLSGAAITVATGADFVVEGAVDLDVGVCVSFLVCRYEKYSG